MWIDSHCHLDYPDFGEELPDILARANNAKIDYMLTICTKISEFERVKAIADGHDHIFCTVGIHPHESEKEPDIAAQRLVELTSGDKVVGIGETGLDFYYDNAPRDAQERNFRAHIEASRLTQLPLIVHTRDADAKTVDILREESGKGTFPGLIHCFSVGREVAEAALDIGFYISISGIVTFKKAEELRDIVKDLPLDRVLVETDAPFLAPIPNRGKRNEPSYVVHTAEKVAEIMDVEPAVLAEATSENFFRLFSKAQGHVAA